MSNEIAIIDLGSGNLQSVYKILKYLNQSIIITSNEDEIRNAGKIILPGVGNFGNIMKEIQNKNLEPVIKEVVKKNKKFLGICVGLQVLFERSEENLHIPGLGILNGSVVKFKNGKIPQIGWNKVKYRSFYNIPDGYAYFVNSFYVIPEKEELITGYADYFGEFTAAIQDKNLWAVQFHPEKSGNYGIEFFRRWLEC